MGIFEQFKRFKFEFPRPPTAGIGAYVAFRKNLLEFSKAGISVLMFVGSLNFS